MLSFKLRRMGHLHANSVTLPRTNKKINDSKGKIIIKKQVIQIVASSLWNVALIGFGQWQLFVRRIRARAHAHTAISPSVAINFIVCLFCNTKESHMKCKSFSTQMLSSNNNTEHNVGIYFENCGHRSSKKSDMLHNWSI